MATYKVIQDIEAEDKFVGPLTLKQFVFAMGGLVFGYLNFLAISWGTPILMLIFAPPMLLGFFLAVPWSKNQPTEVWVLAKLRFYFKPRRKIWDQSGPQELVKVTAPKKIERALTKDFTQTEVKGRLKALADTIDSRGWAIKNSSAVDVAAGTIDSDRLINPASILPAEVDDSPVVNDMLDATQNPEGSKLSQMMETSSASVKDKALDKMEQVRQGKAKTVAQASFVPPVPPTTVPDSSDEQALSQSLKQSSSKSSVAFGRMHSIEASKKPAPTDDKKAQAAMTTPVSPDILELSHNDDLSVATIARQASNKSDDGEVVISLH